MPTSRPPIDAQSSAPAKPRSWHAKTRTGCVTCKSRHVKCDEAEPSCATCCLADRQCEGYPELQPITRKRKKLGFRGFKNTFTTGLPEDQSRIASARLACTSPAKLSYSLTANRMVKNKTEAQAYEFFLTQTIPLWSRYQPSQEWTNVLLSMQQMQATLYQCCVAVGSMHSQITCGDRQPSQENIDASTSISMYTRAIGALRVSLEKGNMHPAALLLACILLAVFESLQWRRHEMLLHLRNGLVITYQNLHSRKQSAERHVAALMLRLGFSHALYGRPRLDSSPEVQLLFSQASEEQNTRRADVTSLRLSLDSVCNKLLGYVHKVDKGSFMSDFEAYCIQANLTNELQSWRDDYECLIKQKTLSKHGSNVVKSCHGIMLARHELASIFVSSYASGCSKNPQTAYDRHVQAFQRIICFIEEALHEADDRDQPDAFSVDLGLIPLLFSVAICCRHSQLRRKAVGLLRRVPQREGIWNAQIAMRISSEVIEREEAGGKAYLADEQDAFGIPEERRIQQVFDICDASIPTSMDTHRHTGADDTVKDATPSSWVLMGHSTISRPTRVILTRRSVLDLRQLEPHEYQQLLV
jgi:hypothetical protein